MKYLYLFIIIILTFLGCNKETGGVHSVSSSCKTKYGLIKYIYYYIEKKEKIEHLGPMFIYLEIEHDSFTIKESDHLNNNIVWELLLHDDKKYTLEPEYIYFYSSKKGVIKTKNKWSVKLVSNKNKLIDCILELTGPFLKNDQGSDPTRDSARLGSSIKVPVK